MKKVAFHNLGCKVNSYELEFVQQKFTENDFRIVPFDQKADIYVINTCTVTNIADRKSRQMLHRAKSTNPEAIVVATGCYVQTDTVGAIKDEAIDFVVGNNEKAKLVEYVEEFINAQHLSSKDELDDNTDASYKTLWGKTIDDLSKDSEYENFCIYRTNEHTRAYIKIQDGCNQFCSYCAIPLARGRVRSRSRQDVLEEVTKLAANGYKEVVLTGIHLSSYGLESSYNIFADGDATNDALLDVIESVANVEGIERIRLGSLEPRLITDDFLKRLVNTVEVCPHFHLSLQSGSDSVLKRMNRQYSSEEYQNKVELIRKYYEHPAITTDVIVGFPQESEEEFDTTRRFLDTINLYETHIFKYSRRKGTVADKMSGQLTDKVKSFRSNLLIEDSNVRKQEFASYYVGKQVSVLAEDTELIDGMEYRVGYTPEYVKCAMNAECKSEIIVNATGVSAHDGVLFVNVN